MSETKQETISDIVAEMRNEPCSWLTPEGIPQQFHDNELFSGFADRIEAAYRREAVENARYIADTLKPVLKMGDQPDKDAAKQAYIAALKIIETTAMRIYRNENDK